VVEEAPQESEVQAAWRARVGYVPAPEKAGVVADLERRRLELKARRREEAMSELTCLVDGRPVGPRMKEALCQKCAGAWNSYCRHKEKAGKARLSLEEWARDRRDGRASRGGRPKGAGGAAGRKPPAAPPRQPARPVGRGPAVVTVEEKLLDHYLASTDWSAIELAHKRELVERLLEVNS
jgi:hypothetical protein